MPHSEAARLPQRTPPAPAVLRSLVPHSLRSPRATHTSNPAAPNALSTHTLRALRTEPAPSVPLRCRFGQPLVASSCGIPDAPLRSPSSAATELRSLRNTSSHRIPMLINSQCRTASLHTTGISQLGSRNLRTMSHYAEYRVVFLADGADALCRHNGHCVAAFPPSFDSPARSGYHAATRPCALPLSGIGSFVPHSEAAGSPPFQSNTPQRSSSHDATPCPP